MKKILFIFFIIFFFPIQAFSSDEANYGCVIRNDNSLYNGFDLYECRVKQICETLYSVPNPSFKTEKFPKAENFLTNRNLYEKYAESFAYGNDFQVLGNAKAIYRSNMSNIYKCAMFSSQENSVKMALEILSQTGNSDDLSQRIEQKLEERLDLLQNSKAESECLGIDQNVNNRDKILKETTYQMCQYLYYLDYLDGHYAISANIVNELTNENGEQISTISISSFANRMGAVLSEISREKSHTKRMYSLVFDLYKDFEVNYVLHILLEVIREDYYVYRQKLRSVLGPINQVAKKIPNAQSIN